MSTVAVPEGARRFLAPFIEKAADLGLPLYIVGGCVRDWARGRETEDFDLVVEGDAAPLAAFCASRLGVEAQAFGRFGTLRVIVPGEARVDFAMSRSETYPTPACLPVVAPAPIEKDLWRRDFTVNAMALRLKPGKKTELIDPYGGYADLRAKTLRVLHEASFRDDPTRVFRAARFLERLGLTEADDLAGLALATLKAGHAALLSRHRLCVELLVVLSEKDPRGALRRLRAWGYLDLIYPRLAWPAVFRQSSAEERLAETSLALGRRGEDFLSGLPLDHAAALRLREVLRLWRGRRAVPGGPSPFARGVLAAVGSELAPGALKPLFLTGEDIAALGLPPGEAYRGILERAGRDQWDGKLRNRREALDWLRRRIKKTP